jgi:hypothetical protein
MDGPPIVIAADRGWGRIVSYGREAEPLTATASQKERGFVRRDSS